MTELLYVILTVVVAAAVITVVARPLEMIWRGFESILAAVSTVVILFVMCFVFGEVIMRYIFNSPIHGHLEGAELLLPIIVFMAISYTQARDGHVGMTLVIDALSPNTRRVVDVVTLVLSLLTCASLSYFGAKDALFKLEIDDVTMSPPYWKIWPTVAMVSIGYFMLAVRMWLQVLQIVMPNRMPEPIRDDSEIHATE